MLCWSWWRHETQTHMLWARICVKKNMKVISRSHSLRGSTYGLSSRRKSHFSREREVKGRSWHLESRIIWRDTKGKLFNSKEDSFTSKRDNLYCPVDKRAKVEESNNVTGSGPVQNQLQVGLEADQIYYQTGPNGKRGKTKVLNEAKLFKLKTIWQVKKPNPASNRFSVLSQT